jgi:DNA-binding NarL/FixJ family response regulator
VYENSGIDVIIVDDHEIVREGLAKSISLQEGMEVVRTCGSAEECLEALKDFSGSLVIIFDIAMSGLCPFTTTEKIGKIRPRNKVIFHSGYLSDALLARARHSGAAGYILKSAPVSELIDGIKDVHLGKTVYPQLGDADYSSEPEGFDPILSPREMEVLRYVAEGLTAKQIGDKMEISTRTAERHKTNIMDKLKVHSQVELARYAIREGFIIP